MRKILPLITIILLIHCTKLFNADPDEGTISGRVTLEEMSDHSGINVSLYESVELDTDILSINQEYPSIGVIISQRTEFDHRLYYPNYETITDQNGYVELLAEQQVSGTITENTTWESNRHYVVTGDVEVPEGVTLTIEPGAVVRFSTDQSGGGYSKLKVRGTLIAVGDSLNWITFTSNEEEMKSSKL